MRVIGGKFKKTTLFGPRPGDDTIRVTYDRIRENVFNILAGRVEGAAVLDLFAGTGCIGIEAVSRGAQKAVFVDAGAESIRLINKNVEKLGIEDRCRIRRSDVPAFLKRNTGGEAFDIIYIDPPYRSDLFEESMELLKGSGLASPGAVVVGEHGRPGRPPDAEMIGGFRRVDYRKYGRFWLTLWESGG